MWLLRSRFLTLPAALCCLVFAGSSHLLAQTSPPLPVEGIGLFRIAGIITSASEGHPLSHARVSLQNVKNFHDQIFMITGDDGHFEFANLHAGKYSLVGGKRGYISAAYDEHEQFSTAIVTGAGVDTENLTLRLVPTAAITGHVFDESGEPVRSAAVTLWRDHHSSGVSRTVRAGADAKDANHLNGSGTIVAVLAVIAIIGGIVAATSGSSKPKSP